MKKHPLRKSCRGFTLVEVLVAAAITVIGVGATMLFLQRFSGSSGGLGRQINVHTELTAWFKQVEDDWARRIRPAAGEPEALGMIVPAAAVFTPTGAAAGTWTRANAPCRDLVLRQRVVPQDGSPEYLRRVEYATRCVADPLFPDDGNPRPDLHPNLACPVRSIASRRVWNPDPPGSPTVASAAGLETPTATADMVAPALADVESSALCFKCIPDCDPANIRELIVEGAVRYRSGGRLGVYRSSLSLPASPPRFEMLLRR